MPLPEFSLEGKVYIVTGGGRGLGVALAGAIVEAGAKKVYCLDLLPEPHEGWVQVKQALALRGQNLVFKGGLNVTDEAGIEKTFEEIVQTEGRLDGLVCAAVSTFTLYTRLMVKGNNLHQRRNSTIGRRIPKSSRHKCSGPLYLFPHICSSRPKPRHSRLNSPHRIHVSPYL